MDVYFGGTLNWRDAKQDVKTAFGGVGAIYKAVREAAELVAEAMAANPSIEINRVLGFSMGGGTAQAFLAGVESRIELRDEPALVVFDPQLLNNAQARHAVKDGPLGYDYSKLRGVAITLDYEADPRMGLMNVMKGPGRYKSPGLVQLRLGLKHGDDFKFVKRKVSVLARTGDVTATPTEPLSPLISVPSGSNGKKKETKEKVPAAPRASGPPFMGYHDNTRLYAAALGRFAKVEPLVVDAPPFIDDGEEGQRDDEVLTDNQPSLARSNARRYISTTSFGAQRSGDDSNDHGR
jgi:hypothetical protein